MIPKRTTLALLAGLSLLAVSAAPPSPYDAAFTGRTMRVDFWHTGGPPGEIVAFEKAVDDGAWAGSRTRLVDELNLGTYRFEVRDPASGRVLFARGYASVYAEWESTPEAKKTVRTFGESLRFPWPKAPVQVSLARRDAQNLFREIWTSVVDPAAWTTNAAPRSPAGKVIPLFENGPPESKVDLLVLGEGYTAAEEAKFVADAKRLVGLLFEKYEPFRSRRNDFNVRLLHLTSAESGVTRPFSKIFRRTPLSAQYGIFGSERYVLTYDDRALRDAASAAPYDALEILVNDSRYGGGGIYGDQATAAAGTAWAEYVFVHEFGHHFAALADEYYTSDVAYETGAADRPEPWEPNVTALGDPARLKWRDLAAPGTPLPTTWPKAEFEAQSKAFQAERKKLVAEGAPPEALDALFRRVQAAETKLLSPLAGKVGAFEGASYEAKGLYRPAADCIMFTRDEGGFCPVCRRAIERIIDRETR
ncbi:MAG TPA: M64 family metallopeptidase [Thermoanaerobaculia bacterium]|nr:M64 family metallopeptidase [Thermoanaerobaculia bacterium]HQR68207.1 M64 family metallopeptidase [Thermoanaerobaculia bacterium]